MAPTSTKVSNKKQKAYSFHLLNLAWSPLNKLHVWWQLYKQAHDEVLIMYVIAIFRPALSFKVFIALHFITSYFKLPESLWTWDSHSSQVVTTI